MDPIDLNVLDIALQSDAGKTKEETKLKSTSDYSASNHAVGKDVSTPNNVDGGVTVEPSDYAAIDTNMAESESSLESDSQSERLDDGQLGDSSPASEELVIDSAEVISSDHSFPKSNNPSEQVDGQNAQNVHKSEHPNDSTEEGEAIHSNADANKKPGTTEQNRPDLDGNIAYIASVNALIDDDTSTYNHLPSATNATEPSDVINIANSSTATGEDEEDEPSPKILVDYASKVSGAQVLEKSSTLKGTSNLLTGDIDRYAIAPCEDKKYVVIGLSEDILVKIIKLANYEKYSSHVKEFQILASQEYPTTSDQWTDLGTYTALSKSGEQTFELKEPAWARYLKFKFLSHYGVEHYCTVSQIKVHGSTMLQGFHEQWIESEKMEMGDGDGEDEGNESEDEVNDTSEGKYDQDHDAEQIKESIGQNEKSEEQIEYEEGVEEGQQEATLDDRDGTEADDSLVYQKTDEQPPDTAKDGNTIVTSEVDLSDVDSSLDQDVDVANKHDATDNEIDENDEHINTMGEVALPSAALSNKVEDIFDSEESLTHEKDESTVDDIKYAKVQVKYDSEKTFNEQTSHEEKLPHHESNEYVKTESSADAISEGFAAIEDIVADSESNITIDVITDAVKAAVVHVADELKHVKDVVDSTDTVAEIKKSIQTTIAVAEEGSATEFASVSEINNDIDEKRYALIDAMNLAEEIESNMKIEEQIQSNSTRHEAGIVNESRTAMEPLLKYDSANCTEDATKSNVNDEQIENKTNFDAETKMQETKAEAINSKKKNKTVSDPAKTQTNASILKVEPTATLPRKRNIMNRSTDDHIVQLIRRYPSASCVKDLEFQSFKTRSFVANVVPGAAIGGGAKMEPIFQKITSEIKSAQTTQHQYEQYISAIKACYEKILFDIANDLDTIESNFDARLSFLEMMSLERSDTRQYKSTNFVGVPIVLALPFHVINFDALSVYHVCLLILILYVLARRIGGKAKSTVKNYVRTIPLTISVKEKELQPASLGEKVVRYDDDIVYPLTALNNIDHRSNSISSEILHAISCEESVDSTPSLAHSEPAGNTDFQLKKASPSKHFQIRKRAKSDDILTPERKCLTTP